jgi:hypothetical protein
MPLPGLRRDRHGWSLRFVKRYYKGDTPWGWVYAVWDGEHVKIGSSTGHPVQRMQTLQTGSSRPLTLLSYTATRSERECHKLLHRDRVRGEWFRLTSQVVKELRRWDWLDVEGLEQAEQAQEQHRSTRASQGRAGQGRP